MKLEEWIAGYARAWERGDDQAIEELFSEQATYRSSPFREPARGHDEIRSYWRRATGSQRETRVRTGRPIIEGSRVAVEWWTTMIDEGEEVTLPGCLLLQFEPDGRCSDLREYWHLDRGRLQAYDGWGEWPAAQ